MYEAEIAWHGGKRLELLSGTPEDGNYIAHILKKRIVFERRQRRIESYLEACMRYEKKTARTVRSRTGRK